MENMVMNIDKITNGWVSDYKVEILEVIANNYDDKGLDTLLEYLEDSINDNGSIDELIDSKIDIYYYSLREWSVDNYGYIEDAMDEFGTTKPFDWHGAIQQGQYMYYSEEVNEAVQELIEHIKENYNV